VIVVAVVVELGRMDVVGVDCLVSATVVSKLNVNLSLATPYMTEADAVVLRLRTGTDAFALTAKK
jgi:hypothetical protein